MQANNDFYFFLERKAKTCKTEICPTYFPNTALVVVRCLKIEIGCNPFGSVSFGDLKRLGEYQETDPKVDHDGNVPTCGLNLLELLCSQTAMMMMMMMMKMMVMKMMSLGD